MTAAVQEYDASLEQSARREREAENLIAQGYKGFEEIEPYVRRWKSLVDARRPMEPIWREVQKFLMPFSGRYLQGDDVDPNEEAYTIDLSHIKDSMPLKMALTAADGLHGGLSSQSQQWFSYYIGNYERYERDVPRDVRAWVENSQNAVRDTLGVSNFYVEIHPFYLEAICFGVAAMMINSVASTKAHYTTKTIGSYWLDQNANQEIDTMYVQVTLRAGDIARKYGKENCPHIVRDALVAGNQDRKFHIIQCIQPWNYFGNVSRHPDFRYEDVRFVKGADIREKPLYRKGYRTKPFVAARWSSTGDYVYGRNCPGVAALPDIMQLQAMTRDYNSASEWTSNPAWLINAAFEKDIKGLRPGKIFAIPGGDPKAAMAVPLLTNAFDNANNINARQMLLERINSHLYNREILLVQSRQRQMTATEVAQLQAEKNAVLGPIVVRMGNEALIPVLDRTFEILKDEWMMFPPAPQEIIGEDILPYFTSELAKAQRQADVLNANNWLQWIIGAAQLDQQLHHSVDLDAQLRRFEEVDYIPYGVIRPKDEVEQRIAAEQQAMQQQMQQQQMLEAINAAKTMGDTSTTPDTALGQIMGEGAA